MTVGGDRYDPGAVSWSLGSPRRSIVRMRPPRRDCCSLGGAGSEVLAVGGPVDDDTMRLLFTVVLPHDRPPRDRVAPVTSLAVTLVY